MQKAKDAKMLLAFLEAASPSWLSERLRVYESGLNLEQKLIVFGVLQRLVRAAPDDAWKERLECPELFGAEYEDDERWVERLVLHPHIYGVEAHDLLDLINYFRESADLAIEHDEEAVAEALCFYISRLVETVAYLMRYRLRASGLRSVPQADLPFISLVFGSKRVRSLRTRELRLVT